MFDFIKKSQKKAKKSQKKSKKIVKKQPFLNQKGLDKFFC